MERILFVLAFALLLAGCGRHYWEAPGRGVGDFRSDSSQCIQDAKTKYEVSERIYRRCMQAQGWKRVQAHDPSYTQFRGPEDEDEFFSPPNPLSARGAPALGGIPPTPATSTMLLGTWSGTIYAANRMTYPYTITFKDDGSWHSTSTLPPGSFNGTWQLNGDRVVWRSITSGRTGTGTLHEVNGARILRMIPDDRSGTTELTPIR